MGIQRADFEPFGWWLARERIGTDLRYHFAASRHLQSRILALVERLRDAQNGDQFREESAPNPYSLGHVWGALSCLQRFRSFT